jgi:hypothetical protein
MRGWPPGLPRIPLGAGACEPRRLGTTSGVSTYRLRTALTAAVMTACLAATVVSTGGPALAAAVTPVTPTVVLVNQPPARVCVGQKIKVGVWYQPSGGSRRYRVDVYNPKGKRVFHRHGRATSAHWRFWYVPATMAGRYRTVYWGHFRNAKDWTPYRAKTIAHHC